MAIYVTVTNAVTITPQCAHTASLSVDGTDPDVNNPPTTWGNIYYFNQSSPVTLVFAGSGTQVLILPDFPSGWLRLLSSGDTVCTSGWEVVGI